MRKERIVNALVGRVAIDRERNLKAKIRLDIFDLGSDGPAGVILHGGHKIRKMELIPADQIHTTQARSLSPFDCP